ncbi:MAG TPA: DUF2169 domain-containing protein, partial [Polyangiaceae bacterium]|nr:DUF2169 domain-containing protein [Polyangiaceae bacterium]
MDIASICSLPVGVLAWRSPRPALSVIVKMTLSLGDAEPSLIDPQVNLSLDRPSSIGAPHELLYASDFVPRKARCDVLLTGHARSSKPSRAIPVRLRAGPIERRFFALAAEPSKEIPLSATYLRGGEGAPTGDVSVGPMDAFFPARAKLLQRAGLGPGGVPLLPVDFDYSAFNAAPPEQQLDTLPSAIELDALLPGSSRRKIHLPSERPRVYAFARERGARGRSIREVPLRCDTLWIDTDRALCSLVWRGVIELAGEEPDLALSLAAFGLAERITDLERRLEGARRVRAAEASDFQAPFAMEDETTPSMEVKPSHADHAKGMLGSLGAMQLGGVGRAPGQDDQKASSHAIPAQKPAPALADDEVELAADEILEVDEVEEIEPEAEIIEDLADEPTPMPADGLRASPGRAGGAAPIPPPELKRNSFDLEESTQTNFQVPQRAALPFPAALDRASPIPAGPDSPERRSSLPDLPFQIQMPSPPAAAAPPAAPLGAESITTKPPDALPFKSKRRTTLIDPPVLAGEVRSALPFVKAAGDAPREAVLPPEPSPAMPVLPFVNINVPADAPRAVPPPSDASSALPFVKPAPISTSVPLVAPPDIPSALPFMKPAAPPPTDVASPPAYVPSALPFVKPAPEATPWAAPAPAFPAFPFLAQLKPVEPAVSLAPTPELPKAEAKKNTKKSLLPLETYAAIQVDLWDEGAVLEDVLARHGVDEITWRDNEQRRAEAV